MALLSLLFDKPVKTALQAPTRDGADSGTETQRMLIELDATLNTGHKFTADPTDHPVEEGANISDNVDLKSPVVTIEGIVSEAPISLLGALIGNVAGAIPAIGGFRGGFLGAASTFGLAKLGGLLLGDDNTERPKQAFDTLREIQNSKVPVTLITGLETYTNMILQEFSPDETPENGNSLHFTATFKQVRFVKSETIILPSSVLDFSVRNGASENLGKKASNAANDQVQAKGSSLLFKLFKG